MSMFISALIFVALLSVSMAHLTWSFGQTWPIREEKLLAQTVVGTVGVERMPPRWASFAVAVFTLAAGILALSLADHTSGGWGLTLSGIPVGAIFLARGIVGYTKWWAERTPEPSFRLNDRRVYSPLCLFVGIGFFALLIMRLI